MERYLETLQILKVKFIWQIELDIILKKVTLKLKTESKKT